MGCESAVFGWPQGLGNTLEEADESGMFEFIRGFCSSAAFCTFVSQVSSSRFCPWDGACIQDSDFLFMILNMFRLKFFFVTFDFSERLF